jgi:hypothetical protein
MQPKDEIYDPFWEYESEEPQRKTLTRMEVRKNAINQNRPGSDVKHEEEVRKEEGEIGVLRLNKQKETGFPKVARLKKKGVKDLQSKRWLHKKLKEKTHGKKKDDDGRTGPDAG